MLLTGTKSYTSKRCETPSSQRPPETTGSCSSKSLTRQRKNEEHTQKAEMVVFAKEGMPLMKGLVYTEIQMKISHKAGWCFMPSQPVRLYQGDPYVKVVGKHHMVEESHE